MSSEDFTNPNPNNHPEVSGATLEIQRPEQVTLRHLLHEISEKSANGSNLSNDRFGTDLHYPDQQTGAATVYRIEKGTSRHNPDRVGQIHVREKVGNDGDEVMTNYFILDTPDGLHMEKHSHTANPRKEMLSHNATLDEIAVAAMNGIAKIAEMRQSQEEEDALGLSFVSEQEARNLLGFLDQLEPFERRSY